MEPFGGIVVVLIAVFFIILFILWAILPFLIVGTNKRLNRVIVLMNYNNKLQEDMREELRKLAGETEKYFTQEQ